MCLGRPVHGDPEACLTQTRMYRQVLKEGTRVKSQAGRKAEAELLLWEQGKGKSRPLRAWSPLLQVAGT